MNPCQATLISRALLLAAISVAISNALVTVEQNLKDPLNPRIVVESNRPETEYTGPLHHFESTYGMHHITLKMDMAAGQQQCYYFILSEGYQFTVFAASVSADEEKFHMFVANSEETFRKVVSDVSSSSISHNVTAADTYEFCIINSFGHKKIMFSAIYYQPQRYEIEIKQAITKSDFVSNATDSTAKFISTLELNIGKALNSMRYKPSVYKDYVILRDSNTYVQWKSIAFLVLMLCSYGGSTLFIRSLFHVPAGGKVSI